MKLSSIEKILLVAIAVVVILLLNGGNKNQSQKKVKIENPTITEITVAEAQSQLQVLSNGLDIDYDDMQELTFYRNKPNFDTPLYFFTYVVLDEHFNAEIGLHIFSISKYPLFFDKLYIKSANNVTTFQLTKTNTNEYNGLMSSAIYNALKKAIESGYVKFRVSGRNKGERELTAQEMTEINAVFSIYEYFSKVKIKN